MTECVCCGALIESPSRDRACPSCGEDGYTDRGAHTPTVYVPARRRPLPDDYEPQWDPREQD